MTVLWYSHDAGREHVTPAGHPERVARLDAVEDGLAPLGLTRAEAPLCDPDDIALCHPASHYERIRRAAPDRGTRSLDADTHMAPGSLGAAMRAVGGAIAGVDSVLDGQAKKVFVGCRPPGHHAERETAMGFCLFGTVAIAARHALDRRGLSRVAVVDFDVHHGNGTQDLLWDEARTLFVSSHQMPLYPGSGHPTETGAHGQVVNLPLTPGTGTDEMRAAWELTGLPRIRDFAPDLILISAGFDAHRDDPLAGLNWEPDDFRWLTERLCDVATECCGGRIVSSLEGGYDLDGLRDSVAAHVEVLMERSR